jgi:2-dehydro-3-deoxyphosphogluconate aldolase/(4S)-4-hydroxy-2-oxoglutarate aldolase
MAAKTRVLQRVTDCGVIAIVRMRDSSKLISVADAVHKGGVDVIEFTMTTPNALETLHTLRDVTGEEVVLGIGTVLDAETARAAILAGADFLVSPTLNPRVVEMCHRYSKVVIPGAFTPTEILTAWELGADFVKLFPATTVGPGYIKDVLAPLPYIKLIPTGGVDLSNAGDFIRAGAWAVAVGGNLVDASAVERGDFDVLTERARQFAQIVLDAKKRS